MSKNQAHKTPRSHRSRSQRRGREQGFSLIEVLVSFFVFSIGLVGMLGISSAALQNNKVAQLRITGTALVNDYAERARMNIRGFDAGKYAIAKSDTAGTAVTFLPNATTDTENKDAANNVAAADVRALLQQAAWQLPSGDAVVTTETSPARALNVWLLWKEPTAASGSIAAELFTQAQRICPTNLSDDDAKVYSCMYFMVPL